MTKVKICGITNLEDAQLSAKFGADALGFNFYKKSPRYILPDDARKIIDKLPEEILNVGVFVNEELEKIVEIAKTANLNAIQLHGEESPEFAKEIKEKINLEIIKAFRVSPEFLPEDVLQYEVDAILLDAYSPKEHGGTGETFDWEIAKRVQDKFSKMYLAGGLNTNNIVHAVKDVSPFTIDVCSGIEKIKGRKDKVSLINLIKLTRNIDWWKKIQRKENFKLQNNEELMRLIHIYPALYIGKKSLSSLFAFLSGLSFSCGIHQDNCDHSFQFSEKFMLLLQSKYGSIPSLSILRECDGDETKAFEAFFSFFEEFKITQKGLINEQF